MKTASGSPGSKLPGEPGTTWMAKHRLVESTTDVVADSSSHGDEFKRVGEGQRGSIPRGTAEKFCDGQVEEHSHWKCTVIVDVRGNEFETVSEIGSIIGNCTRRFITKVYMM